MAKSTPAPGFGVVSGKIGGITYAKGKDNTQILRKSITKSTNPSSRNQSLQRNYLALLSKNWYQVLTPAMRATWDSYAAAKYGARTATGGGARSIIHANTGRGGGKGLYIYVNQNMLRNGAVLLTAPVPGGLIPACVAGLTVACVAGTLTVTWTPDADIAHSIQIWGVGTGKLAHRQVIGNAAGAAGTKDITAIKGAGGDPILLTALVGSYLWVQLEVINTVNGLASNPSVTLGVAIA